MIAAPSANESTAAEIAAGDSLGHRMAEFGRHASARWTAPWSRASDQDHARVLAWTVALGALPALLLGVVVAWLMSPPAAPPLAATPIVTAGATPILSTPVVPTPVSPTPIKPVPLAPVPLVPASAPTSEAPESAPVDLHPAAPPASVAESASPVVPAAVDVAPAGTAA